MKIAYLDCFSGISGDMMVGALLDAGFSIQDLRRELSRLDLSGYQISAKKEARNNIFGTKFSVSYDPEKQGSRYIGDIKDILINSKLSQPVISKCISVFEKIARAEGEIHNISPERVHFHEIGAIDSILDIVATVAGIHKLGIEKLYSSMIPLGRGIVESAHGLIPVPAPATVKLLEGIPVDYSGQEAEMVTPTGAALVSSLCSFFGPMPPMIIERSGYGVGTRHLSGRPNLLRIIIGDESEAYLSDTVVCLEANLDDLSPEVMGYLMDILFSEGALDVCFAHIQMKKNRPGVQIQVICRPEHREKLINIIFRESTTLGIRHTFAERALLKREKIEVQSPWGKMYVKKTLQQDGSTLTSPEYEECRRIARKKRIPLRDVYSWVASLQERLE